MFQHVSDLNVHCCVQSNNFGNCFKLVPRTSTCNNFIHLSSSSSPNCTAQKRHKTLALTHLHEIFVLHSKLVIDLNNIKSII